MNEMMVRTNHPEVEPQPPQSLYETLGVSSKATQEELKKAFRQKALEAHPDRGGDEQLFKRINGAYQILSDPERRASYDATLFEQPEARLEKRDTQKDVAIAEVKHEAAAALESVNRVYALAVVEAGPIVPGVPATEMQLRVKRELDEAAKEIDIAAQDALFSITNASEFTGGSGASEYVGQGAGAHESRKKEGPDGVERMIDKTAPLVGDLFGTGEAIGSYLIDKITGSGGGTHP